MGVQTLVNKHFLRDKILGGSQFLGFIVVLGGFEVFLYGSRWFFVVYLFLGVLAGFWWFMMVLGGF